MLRLWLIDTEETWRFELLRLVDRYHDRVCLLRILEHRFIIMVRLWLSWIHERLF